MGKLVELPKVVTILALACLLGLAPLVGPGTALAGDAHSGQVWSTGVPAGLLSPEKRPVPDGQGLFSRLETRYNAMSLSPLPTTEAPARVGEAAPVFASPNTPSALGDQDMGSGYLAVEVRSGSLGLALGGGYSLSSAATTAAGGSAGSGPVLASSSSRSASSSATSTTAYDAYRRWSAYLAVPYQLTERFALRPEVSYFHDESLTGQGAEGNEWVMGLQFNFGF